MDNTEVRGYLNTLFLDAKDEELDFITTEVNQAIEVMNLIDNIDTTNVKMATWGYESETSILRDDIVDHTITNEEALQNASEVQDGYVKYVKVV